MEPLLRRRAVITAPVPAAKAKPPTAAIVGSAGDEPVSDLRPGRTKSG
ncbi:hypothetical protein ACFZDJ_35440 [Streptomyces sp. NPDC007896]|nr:hypothetical protein [Streptomyces sp. S1D4-11]QIY96649.1 hypothetical protein HEP87_24850 [Streptomyces sp. S1D4-11]